MNGGDGKGSIRILLFGNSYGNDALKYLPDLLTEGGCDDVIIGQAGESSMLINDHYHNIDDDPNNDYVYQPTGKTFSVHRKQVNGRWYDLPADYKAIVADEPWDYVIFYQGPSGVPALTQDEYYSELDGFISALKKYMTNPDGKILYYMTWAHNVEDTRALYDGIADVTRRLILPHPRIDGVIPAATLIENLRSSFLVSGKGGDITRDWGHLNYGAGRYAMATLFYAYITGGELDAITYRPDPAKLTDAERKCFREVDDEALAVIREAVRNALDSPFEPIRSSFPERREVEK